MEGTTITVRYESDLTGNVWEDDYAIRKFKQFNPETKLLQFYAVAGGLRTIHVDRIIRIKMASSDERLISSLSLRDIAALGENRRKKK